MGIDRNNAILNMMYRGTTTIENFNWDSMTTVPILSLMTSQDIDYIKQLILSPRYSGNNKYKIEKIDDIMHLRGFTRFAGGTNRLVYVHPSAPNAVFKVAIDSVGINDNPAEFRNQNFLKPYCCKVFECSPCGTIASFEKVDRITTFEEFYTIADDYYYIIVNVILGKYVMDDIGIDYFMNFGIRVGCYPVILDFPYLFELDGRKLECCNVLDDGRVCGGEIDYDAGFNKLVCKKCGRIYRARDLAKPPKEGGILLRQRGGRRMKLEITRGDKVIKTYDSTIERDWLSRNDREATNNKMCQVTIERVPKESKPKVQTPKVETKTTHRAAHVESPVKKVIKEKEVNVSNPNVREVNTINTSRDNSIGVEIVKTVKTVSKPVVKANKGTDTKKVAVSPKTEVAHLEKPIIGRVIDVSLDKPKATPIEVVKADPNKVDPFIEVTVTKEKKEIKPARTMKFNHIGRIDGKPVMKTEEEAPKNVKTVEISLDKSVDEKEIVEEPEAKNSKVEEKTEVVEDIDKNSINPTKPITAELNPSEKAKEDMKNLRPAIYFGDDPNDYDPEMEIEEKKPEELAEEEVKEENSSATPTPSLMFLSNMKLIDTDPEYDINYIMDYVSNNNIDVEAGTVVNIIHIDHPEKDDPRTELVTFKTYCYMIDGNGVGQWMPVEQTDDSTISNITIPDEECVVYDNSIPEKEETEIDPVEDGKYPEVDTDKAPDEEEEPAVGDKAEEPTVEVSGTSDDEVESVSEEDDEEEYAYKVKVVDKIPSIDEVEDDIFYCLLRYTTSEDKEMIGKIIDMDTIDEDKYRVFYKVEDEVVQISYEHDIDSWLVVDNEPSTNFIDDIENESFEFVDELPAYDDAESDKYYLLKSSIDIDGTIYDAFNKGNKKWKWCFKVITPFDEVNPEEQEATSTEEAKTISDEEEVDEMIKQLKGSYKGKASLDEYLK